MKLFRGAITAVMLAATFAATLRVRGTGGTPPQHGGWRPLELPPELPPEPARGREPELVGD